MPCCRPFAPRRIPDGRRTLSRRTSRYPLPLAPPGATTWRPRRQTTTRTLTGLDRRPTACPGTTLAPGGQGPRLAQRTVDLPPHCHLDPCRFGIAYHPDHVGRFLHTRLRWSCQKPQRRAWERDDADIDRWKRDEFPRILREVRSSAVLTSLSSTNQAFSCWRRYAAPGGRRAKHRSCLPGTAATASRRLAPSRSARSASAWACVFNCCRRTPMPRHRTWWTSSAT